jgi:NADH-quinone oxidoreductase subunit G
MDQPLEGDYQGNLADICPVGALTLKKFRFQARVWNLEKHPSTCGECSRGCSIRYEVLRGQEVKRVRPRYNPEVNQWWICDHGRFTFEHLNAPDRVDGARRRAAHGWESIDTAAALERAAEWLRVNPEPAIVVSPWLTVEEGERVVKLAQELGVTAAFVAPPEVEIDDPLLQTGDRCPNRRGLGELGLEPIEPQAVVELLASKTSSLLIGERVVECIGSEALAGLPEAQRLIVFDTHALEVPACRLCIGVPNSAERSGTWVNVDGHRGTISAAKSPPRGVRTLVGSLERLIQLMVQGEVRA